MVVANLEFFKKTSKQNFWHRRQIWLNCEQQLENSIPVLIWFESDEESNTNVIEYIFIFPTVICAPRYDKRFRSYAILKSAGLLKFWADQIWAIWEF
jgi:hypothetical protein